MRNYVVTGFDEKYWPRWGQSWFLSLKEVAKHDDIIVVGFNLSQSTTEKISSCAKVISHSATCNFRSETLRQICSYASSQPGTYAYWDATAYFQEEIKGIFSLVNGKIAITSEPGFLAASHSEWKIISEIQKVMDFTGANDLHEVLKKHFPNFVAVVDDTWNFTDIPALREFDGKLAIKENIKKVIHPKKNIQSMLANQNILFSERYKHLFPEKKKSVRKLIKVSCTTNKK